MTKPKIIRVGVKAPNQPIVFKDIPNTLEAFQKEVGGYLELVHPALLDYAGLDVFLDEDGSHKALEIQTMPWGTNQAVTRSTLKVYGPILFVYMVNPRTGRHEKGILPPQEAALSKLFNS